MQQSESSTSSKDFEIYYYGIEDYYRIMKEIDTLTENRINKFRRNNNVLFHNNKFQNLLRMCCSLIVA